MKIVFSVVVPVPKINDYIRKEIIPALEKQSFKDFELIIVPDKKPGREKFPSFVKIYPSWPKLGPADKKDLGARKAKGEIIAFLDDDAYPSRDWLKNALSCFKLQASNFKRISAVCGPGVTPPNDSLLSQVSGWMWSSWLGAGGAGTYRCWPGKKREVDDCPTFNLIVRKKDFKKVGGFDSGFWPGEDTKFCHDLVYKLKKKIIYDPKVLVYHHRRDIFTPHLKQIGRYGLHRGFFVKILPKTSKRLGYFIPALFALGVILGPLTALFSPLLFKLYSGVIGIYIILVGFTSLWVLVKSKNLIIAVLLAPTIFISHLYYGLRFLQGLLKKGKISKYKKELGEAIT
ncbi:glycosyltransferase [Candidatus Shapirobacteria bacterium]|nr:glycosyltransferase [Candidatus Shapirobacteria bacterium]